MLGILFFDKESWAFDISVVLGCAGVLSYLLLSFSTSHKTEKLKLIALLIGIIAFGGVASSLTRQTPNSFSKMSSLIVEVKEIARPTDAWRKAICVTTHVVDNDSLRTYSERVLVFFKSNQIEVGDVLMLNANFSMIENKNNPGEFDVKSFWNNKNIYQIGFVGERDFRLLEYREPNFVKQFFLSLRDQLSFQLSKMFDEDVLGVANALLLGDKQLLSAETRTNFSNAGAMHVLAVSGLHVGIVLYVLMFILGRFPKLISKTTAVLTAVVIIWLYAGVTGFSPSVIRASFMFSMLVLAQLAGRNFDAMNILFFTAFVLLVIDPLLIYDIGFQLSYLAMVGIFVLYPIVSTWFYIKNEWIRKLWEGTAVGIAAQAFTVPLTLYYFHQFPNYFMLTNIGMMVFSGVLLGVGLLFFAVQWSTYLAVATGWVLKVGILVMLYFVQFIDWIPGSVAKGFVLSPVLVSLIYFLIICAIFLPLKRLKIPVFVTVLIVFIMVHWERYENLKANEVVVFNADDVVISLKSGGDIYCFHSATEERIKKVELLMQGYTSVRPGDVKYFPLRDGETKFSHPKLDVKFSKDKYGVDVKSDEVSFYLRTGYATSFVEMENVLDMSYLASNAQRYNLEQGAKIIALN